MSDYICDCGHPESEHGSFTRGYGVDSNGKTSCYDCCAKADKDYMVKHGKIDLYLVKEMVTDKEYKHFVTNWPSSLKLKVYWCNKGHHNIAGTRYDVWFKFNNHVWHGVQYGDNTQICHCKQTKELA